MNVIGKLDDALETLAKDFTVEPLAKDLQPVISDAIKKHGKDRQRKSVLSPLFTVWLILGLPLRRELSYHNMLDWLVSGLRSLGWNLPRHPLADGTITHARKRIGIGVIRDLFYASAGKAEQLAADFYGLVSMAVDGSSMTMPDTTENALEFSRPSTGRGVAAFPQIRVVALVATAVQSLVDVAFGPCTGKGTGERTLASDLIQKNARAGVLFLLDRGFYGFDLLNSILKSGAHLLIRIPSSVKLKPIRNSRLPDGSYLAWMTGKIEDPAGTRAKGRKRWIEVRHQLRIVRYKIRGFRSTRIATSLLQAEITAREIVRHYHRRWEIELVYDSIKTHQCGTTTGQCRTIFRSKLPDLVKQELYAMLTVFNLLRGLMNEAARKHGLDPLSISFTDSLHAVLDAIPGMRRAPAERLRLLFEQLLDDIAQGVMKRWRRPRAYPRVVKVKMSNFRLKTFDHHEASLDFSTETRVLGEAG